MVLNLKILSVLPGGLFLPILATLLENDFLERVQEEHFGDPQNFSTGLADVVCDRNKRTIFARQFPNNTTVEEVYDIPEFQNAVQVTLPECRHSEGYLLHNKGIRGFAYIEFRTETECLDVLSKTKNLTFKGAKVQTKHSKT